MFNQKNFRLFLLINISKWRHQLIGREKELAELETLIQKPNVPVIILAG